MTDAIPSVLSRYIAGLKRHDVSQVASTVADDLVVMLPGRTLAKPEFLGFLTALYKAFPDWRYEHDEPEEGDDGSFTVRWRQGGTHTEAMILPGAPSLAATGKAVHIPEQLFFYRIFGGQLIEIRPEPIAGGAPWGILEQLAL